MRRRRRTAIAAALLAAIATAVPGPRAEAGVHEVEITDNRFVPAQIRVDLGDEITWTMTGGGPHTVTADDRSFSSGRLDRLDTYRASFLTEGYVPYHCDIHGDMTGVVIVGDPPPPAQPPPPPARRVPTSFPTIMAALTGAQAGTVIELTPGTYRESVVLTTPGVTLWGLGHDESDVVIDAAGFSVGVYIAAPGVTVRGLTVRGASHHGIAVDRTERFSIENVRALDNGLSGLSATRSSRGTVRRFDAAGAGEAGIHIQDCLPCDILLDEVEITSSAYGYLGRDAGAVTIIRSVLRGNAVGIAVLGRGMGPRAEGGHLWGNAVTDSGTDPREHRGFAARTSPPSGTGIWLASAWRLTVERNVVAGNSAYGIAVSSLAIPSYGHVITDNLVSGSGKADLAWDGLGARVCFDGNSTLAGGPPTTAPPLAQTIYSCSAPVTVGIPDPAVIAYLARAPAEA